MTTARAARLYRAEIDNTPGRLAAALAPFAEAGHDLEVVMAYRMPGDRGRAAVEVYPVTSRKLAAAAAGAGFAPMTTPMLIVEGRNTAGAGARLAAALAEASINVQYLVAQVVKGRFHAVLGFESDRDAKRASRIVTAPRKPARRPPPQRRPAQ
jgi:hypothetical protein